MIRFLLITKLILQRKMIIHCQKSQVQEYKEREVKTEGEKKRFFKAPFVFGVKHSHGKRFSPFQSLYVCLVWHGMENNLP